MYRYPTCKVAGKTALVHRVVMAEVLGRPLARDEHVHHKNEDTFDYRPENLQVMSPAEHAEHHKTKHPRVKVCAVCGVSFEPHPTKRARAVTCSRSCGIARSGKMRAKLTDEDVAGIVAALAAGDRGIDIAERYGVSPSAVSLIKKRPPVARALVEANMSAVARRAA